MEGEVTHKLDGKTTRHSIRATAATAFIGTTAAAAAVFCPHGAFEHLRLPPSCCQPVIAARAPGYAGMTSWPLPTAVSAPWAKSRRHVKSFEARHGGEPASLPSCPARTSPRRSGLFQSCPAPTPLNRRDDLNSIRRIGHRHGCMPHTCQVRDRVRSVRGLSHQDRQTRQIEARHSSD